MNPVPACTWSNNNSRKDKHSNHPRHSPQLCLSLSQPIQRFHSKSEFFYFTEDFSSVPKFLDFSYHGALLPRNGLKRCCMDPKVIVPYDSLCGYGGYLNFWCSRRAETVLFLAEFGFKGALLHAHSMNQNFPTNFHVSKKMLFTAWTKSDLAFLVSGF